jgi:hypothetical protein
MRESGGERSIRRPACQFMAYRLSLLIAGHCLSLDAHTGRSRETASGPYFQHLRSLPIRREIHLAAMPFLCIQLD